MRNISIFLVITLLFSVLPMDALYALDYSEDLESRTEDGRSDEEEEVSYHVHIDSVSENSEVTDQLLSDEIESNNEHDEIQTFSQNVVTNHPTSKLGHLKNGAIIYEDLENLSNFTEFHDIEQVYYIKKEAELNGDIYYLISKQPSSTNGTIGWTKKDDIETLPHYTISSERKTLYVNGDKRAYNKAWGGENDVVYQDITQYKNYNFDVNLTETVGDEIWYRGNLDGETVFLHSSQVTEDTLNIQEGETSRLGHLSRYARIHGDLNRLSSYQNAYPEYTHAVYYIKKEAMVNDSVYYLISYEPSATRGTVGWVNSDNMEDYPHYTVDNHRKNLRVSGQGSAYAKAWGGQEDLVYEDLSKFSGEDFAVNLTETVGDDIWYRGRLADKTVFIHSDYVLDGIDKSTTSKLGHLRSGVLIYSDLNLNDYQTAEGSDIEGVYYIKKQASIGADVFYLISTQPSATRGVVGWVREDDIETLSHYTVNNQRKALYVNGDGSAFNKAWGGEEDIVYRKISDYTGYIFEVNLKETVGDQIWYRGVLGGETVFLRDSQVTEDLPVTGTSKLGHLNRQARIHKDLNDLSIYESANPNFTHAVYYIKQQTELNGDIYYLISLEPSSTRGVIGWVKANEMEVYHHITVDNQSKTLYVDGDKSAYSKAWGGKRDIVYEDLDEFKSYNFKVNLTETVGQETWYRGILDGKQVFIHSSQVTENRPTINESSTSKLGHLSRRARIHEDLNYLSNYKNAHPNYTHAVYYIKKEATVNGELYYLISLEPSALNGTIGWVKASDMEAYDHTTINNESMTLYVKGQGYAYTKAWGGREDIVYDISDYQGAQFKVNLTETVGNELWYRGMLDGKTVFLHSDNVEESSVFESHTEYNISLNKMIDIQLGVSPQTDKYRNEPAYVHSSLVGNTLSRALISGNGVALRTEPSTVGGTSTVHTRVNSGTQVEIIKEVSGSSVSGSTLWFEIRYSGNTLYVHSSLVNINSKTGRLTTRSNIRAEANTNSHIYASLNSGTSINILNEVTGSSISGNSKWYQISLGAWRLPTRSDLAAYVDPRLQDPFQFLVLSEVAGASATELNQALSGKGVLHNKGQSFVEGARRYGVNEAYLVSHALLESGNGRSTLATGVEVGLNSSGVPVVVTNSNRNDLTDIKTVYNMYGINARDHDPLNLGATYAYRNGWTSVDIAIVEGAAFVSQSYFNRGQDTLYKMRWNPANPGNHQYATDIGWAAKQVSKMKEMYEFIDNPRLVYDIPVFR